MQKLPVSPAADTAAGALPVLLVLLVLPVLLLLPALLVEPERAEEPGLGAEVLAALVAEPPEQAVRIRQSPAAAAAIAAAAGVDRSGGNVVPFFSGRGWPST